MPQNKDSIFSGIKGIQPVAPANPPEQHEPVETVLFSDKDVRFDITKNPIGERRYNITARLLEYDIFMKQDGVHASRVPRAKKDILHQLAEYADSVIPNKHFMYVPAMAPKKSKRSAFERAKNINCKRTLKPRKSMWGDFIDPKKKKGDW